MVINNSKAQGTIEYLVIMAVVVVIALIVVGLFTGIFSNSSQQVSTSSDNFSTVSGGISVVESVIDLEGDSLIRFNNNSSDLITLTKISVGNVDSNYLEQIVGLDSKTFSISGLTQNCPCLENQKNVKCEFKIEYITASGITQTEYRTINAQCVNDSTAVNGRIVIEPIVTEPVVVLEDGSLEKPWIVNTCIELQAMNQNPADNYFLGKDIDCSDTINWNSGLGFEPIGEYEYCDNRRCGVQVTCEREVGCGGQWIESAQCSADYGSLCDWGETECSLCQGSYEWVVDLDNYGCVNPQTQITCNDSLDLCQRYCGTWLLPNTCSESACVSQDECVKEVGCASNWNIAFRGSLDGNGKIVSSLYINRPSEYAVGLFGNLYGSVQNIGVVDANVRGYQQVGILAGYSRATSLTKSFTTGRVYGTNDVGGFVGRNSRAISNSYSLANVSGQSYVGGFTGTGGVNINNSYFLGSVVCSIVPGGLSGSYSGLGVVSNSFAIVENSGELASLTGICDNGASMVNSYFYDSDDDVTLACTNCDCSITHNPLGLNYFFDKTSSLLSQWDFDTIWEENSGALPTLKIFN